MRKENTAEEQNNELPNANEISSPANETTVKIENSDGCSLANNERSAGPPAIDTKIIGVPVTS